jgi:hypothetical protein
MSTQEEINKYVEQLIQERAIAAKIADIKTVEPELTPELDKEVEAAYQAYLAVYNNHKHMNRSQYIAVAQPLINYWMFLKGENISIKEQNQVTVKDANVAVEAERKALEEKEAAVKAANEEVFKKIAIAEDIKVP